MRFTCALNAASAHIISRPMPKNGIPHLIDERASGAASSTSARSASRMARRWGGCRVKNASIGAPRSARDGTGLRPVPVVPFARRGAFGAFVRALAGELRRVAPARFGFFVGVTGP